MQPSNHPIQAARCSRMRRRKTLSMFDRHGRTPHDAPFGELREHDLGFTSGQTFLERAWHDRALITSDRVASRVGRIIIKKAFAIVGKHLVPQTHKHRLVCDALDGNNAPVYATSKVRSIASTEDVLALGSSSVIAQAGARSRETSAQSPSVSEASILVVDDDVLLAESMQQVLSEHRVDISIDAQKALVQIQAGQRYDLIFCDMMMPDMAGMEFYEHVYRCAPEQARRIVFMTGGAFTERARDFLRNTQNPRIEKPFDVDQLLGLIQERLLQTSSADYQPADCPQGA